MTRGCIVVTLNLQFNVLKIPESAHLHIYNVRKFSSTEKIHRKKN